MLATDVADARGRSLAIAAVMSFSKFSGGYGPKGLSAIYETYVQPPCINIRFPQGPRELVTKRGHHSIRRKCRVIR
jgi:hypothetical protein